MHTAASRPASVHSRATHFSCRLTAARPALRLRGGAVESLVARRAPAQQLVAASEASGGGGIDFGLLAAFAGW